MIKQCLQCGTDFKVKPSRVAIGRAKFHIKECYWKSLEGRRLSPQTEIKKGQHLSIATEIKKGQFKNEKHPMWKGNAVSYVNLHKWVSRNLGMPTKCEHCGIEGAKKYEWANISKEYKRILTDWVRLCTSCHRKYDGHSFKAWQTRKAMVSVWQ